MVVRSHANQHHQAPHNSTHLNLLYSLELFRSTSFHIPSPVQRLPSYLLKQAILKTSPFLTSHGRHVYIKYSDIQLGTIRLEAALCLHGSPKYKSLHDNYKQRTDLVSISLSYNNFQYPKGKKVDHLKIYQAHFYHVAEYSKWLTKTVVEFNTNHRVTSIFKTASWRNLFHLQIIGQQGRKFVESSIFKFKWQL